VSCKIQSKALLAVLLESTIDAGQEYEMEFKRLSLSKCTYLYSLPLRTSSEGLELYVCITLSSG